MSSAVPIGEGKAGFADQYADNTRALVESLVETLRDLGLRMGRFKTGTPPRLERASVDLDRFASQPGDADPWFFSPRVRELAAEYEPR